MRSIILLGPICLLIIFTFHTLAHGKEDVVIKKIYFAEEANWPPFTPNKFGTATEGLSLDLMQEIFSRLGIEVEVELYPQKRMLEYLRRGEKDGATIISKNTARLKFLDYTDPIFLKRGLIYFLVDKESPIDWENYGDLKGLQIGTVAGHNYGEKFDHAIEKYNLSVHPVNRIKQNFDKLIARRIDAFFCIELTANQFLRDPEYKGKITHAPKSYYSKGYHIGFSKKSKSKFLITRVNKVIREMKKNGSIKKIISKHIN